jgi:glycosyltransferase involved in cell wall biosynthesis
MIATMPKNIILLGRISDDDLAQALAGARAFLFPSRIEGFGLPAVEAMASGCPVVASTAPCLPEICGDAALYAGPDDAEGWIAAIERLHTDSATRSRTVEAGIARARRYTWRRIAEQYLELMAELDGAGARLALHGGESQVGRDGRCC